MAPAEWNDWDGRRERVSGVIFRNADFGDQTRYLVTIGLQIESRGGIFNRIRTIFLLAAMRRGLKRR